MRFNYDNSQNYDGETRVVRRFAFFPISANSETVWLEWVYIKQTYSSNYADSGWKNTMFIKPQV